MLGPWKVYRPEYDGELNIEFLICEEMDWYKLRDHLSRKYLIITNEDGEIFGVFTDFTQAYPKDLYIGLSDTLPEDYHKDRYRFSKEGFYRYTPTEEERQRKHARTISFGVGKVTDEINSLLMLKNLGQLKAHELIRLHELTEFVKVLRKVDIDNPVWPDLPSDIK